MKTYWDLNKMPELAALPDSERNRILKSTQWERPVRWAILKGTVVCGLCGGLGSLLGDLMLPRWHIFPGWFTAIGGGIGGALLVMFQRAAWAKVIREAVHAEQGV
jgi:hypothetical protein